MTAKTDNEHRNHTALWGVGLVATGVLLLLGRFSPWFNGLIWASVLAVVGTIIFVMYRGQPDKGWTLIPAYSLWAIAGLIGVSLLEEVGLVSEDLIGAYVFYAIAAPFLYVYLRDRKRWWALIPAGIMGLTGTAFLISATARLIPALMIVAGIYLLARHFRNRARVAAKPLSGPEADKAPS
jgi:hypothetical protein